MTGQQRGRSGGNRQERERRAARMMNLIGLLPDDMIKEAMPESAAAGNAQKSEKRCLFWVPRLTAACLCLLFAGILWTRIPFPPDMAGDPMMPAEGAEAGGAAPAEGGAENVEDGQERAEGGAENVEDGQERAEGGAENVEDGQERAEAGEEIAEAGKENAGSSEEIADGETGDGEITSGSPGSVFCGGERYTDAGEPCLPALPGDWSLSGYLTGAQGGDPSGLYTEDAALIGCPVYGSCLKEAGIYIAEKDGYRRYVPEKQGTERREP